MKKAVLEFLIEFTILFSVLGPITLAIIFENGWWLYTYVITFPILIAVIVYDDENTN